MQTPPLPPQPCQQLVGFLFKRRCERLSRVGCRYCKGQDPGTPVDYWQQGQDPYYTERSSYPNYGRYGNESWSDTLMRQSRRRSWGSGNPDFTDGDAASLRQEHDQDYEQEMGAS